MSPATESIVRKLVVLATVAGLGSALAFLLVACGGGGTIAARSRPASWEKLPAAPFKAKGLAGLTSAWTGKELIVTAVQPGPDGTFINSKDVAAAYDPSTRSWRRLPAAPKMQNYCRQDAAWTGSQMVLWGCGQAALDPAKGAWRMLPKAPTGHGFLAWTGSELVGWGGGCCGDAWDGGSAYDPASNQWHTLARSPLAPAQGPMGVWNGHELIVVVSGYSPDDKPYPASFARTAAYDPATDTWRRLAAPLASELRYGGVAAWDGHELLVVGSKSARRQALLAFNPATDRWHRLAQPPRGLNPLGAFWTGKRLLVLGGDEALRALVYDPKTDRWTALPRMPLLGSYETATWTGHELIVWSSAGGAVFTPASD